MPQQDELACELKHPKKVVEPAFPTDRKTAEVLQPREEPLDSPPAAVPAQYAAVLRTVFPVAAVRGDHLHTCVGQFSVQAVGIVGIIADESLYGFVDEEFR